MTETRLKYKNKAESDILVSFCLLLLNINKTEQKRFDKKYDKKSRKDIDFLLIMC